MKILCISDTHGKHRMLKRLPEADIIVHAGDVTSDDSERSALDFMNWFSGLDYKYKLFIAGNHDFFFERESANYILKRILDNIVYLNDSGVEIEGFKFWGSPITPEFFNWAFNRKRGSEINKHWKLVPKDTNILVTHGPPNGILDKINATYFAGRDDLLKRVKLLKPELHIFGHIHEGYGLAETQYSKFVPASILDAHYNISNSPILIDI